MKPWRIVVISAVLPVAEPLIASLQAMGHDVVAWLMARRPQDKDKPPPMWGEVTDKTAPQGINLLMVRDKADLAGLLRGLEPDVALCWGFGWKIPQEALDVPRYGIVNQPGAAAALPRPHSDVLGNARGRPGLRDHLAPHGRRARHRPVLAQTSIPILDEETTIFETGPRMPPRRGSAARGPRPRPAGTGRAWGGSEEDYATTTGRRRRLGRPHQGGREPRGRARAAAQLDGDAGGR